MRLRFWQDTFDLRDVYKNIKEGINVHVMLRCLFMILRRKWINKKIKEELANNNMTHNNDHQQILWHGNKRKKYARIVWSKHQGCADANQVDSKPLKILCLVSFTLFFLFITTSIMMKIKKRENAYIIIIIKWSQTARMLIC